MKLAAPAPLRRRNLSLPGVDPTEPQASRPSVEPTEPQPNVSLPGPGPKQPKDQDHQCAAHTIGLGIVGAALVFLLTFVCVAGWRARRAGKGWKRYRSVGVTCTGACVCLSVCT